MKKILHIIANLIAFCCAMELWQFNFPPRLIIFDVLSIVFIYLFFIYYFVKREKFQLKKELKCLILFRWLYIFVILISGFRIIFSSFNEDALLLYLKGASSEIIYAIFFTTFILYLTRIESGERKKIVGFYIAGVICSCLYGILQMLIYKEFAINTDYFWKNISYNTNLDFSGTDSWAVMGITRGRGFPGVDAAATYVATVLPLLFLNASNSKKIKDKILALIAILGLLITMSRTGIVSIFAAFLLLAFFERKRLFRMLMTVVLVSVPLLFLAYFLRNYIVEILKFRIQVDYTRLELFKGGLYLFCQNPLIGIGANNYSIARLSLPDVSYQDMNLHNSWLTILVELGSIGLLLNVLFFGYIIHTAYLRRNSFSISFICAMVGLSVGGFFNQVFDAFYFNFYVILFYSIIILGDYGEGFMKYKVNKKIEKC